MEYRNATFVWNRLMARKITKRLCLLDALNWCQTLKDTAQKMKFSIKDFLSKCDPEAADLVTFTEEILNEKLIFCAVGNILYSRSKKIVDSGHNTCYEIVWHFTLIQIHAFLLKLLVEKTVVKTLQKVLRFESHTLKVSDFFSIGL